MKCKVKTANEQEKVVSIDELREEEKAMDADKNYGEMLAEKAIGVVERDVGLSETISKEQYLNDFEEGNWKIFNGAPMKHARVAEIFKAIATKQD